MKNCFLHFSTEIAEIQNMSLANENTLKNEFKKGLQTRIKMLRTVEIAEI